MRALIIVSDRVIDVSDCDSLMVFFFQAEDGIRDLVRSRGLGDVYKRQPQTSLSEFEISPTVA